MGYIIAGVFSVNLLYALFTYAVRHEGWFFTYNANFGWHTNSELAWQTVYSVILLLLGWGLISLSRKKLKAKPESMEGPR